MTDSLGAQLEKKRANERLNCRITDGRHRTASAEIYGHYNRFILDPLTAGIISSWFRFSGNQTRIFMPHFILWVFCEKGQNSSVQVNSSIKFSPKTHPWQSHRMPPLQDFSFEKLPWGPYADCIEDEKYAGVQGAAGWPPASPPILLGYRPAPANSHQQGGNTIGLVKGVKMGVTKAGVKTQCMVKKAYILFSVTRRSRSDESHWLTE